MKYEVSFSYGSKVMAKIKVDIRQTDQQTCRYDKSNMLDYADHSIPGLKMVS